MSGELSFNLAETYLMQLRAVEKIKELQATGHDATQIIDKIAEAGFDLSDNLIKRIINSDGAKLARLKAEELGLKKLTADEAQHLIRSYHAQGLIAKQIFDKFREQKLYYNPGHIGRYLNEYVAKLKEDQRANGPIEISSLESVGKTDHIISHITPTIANRPLDLPFIVELLTLISGYSQLEKWKTPLVGAQTPISLVANLLTIDIVQLEILLDQRQQQKLQEQLREEAVSSLLVSLVTKLSAEPPTQQALHTPLIGSFTPLTLLAHLLDSEHLLWMLNNLPAKTEITPVSTESEINMPRLTTLPVWALALGFPQTPEVLAAYLDACNSTYVIVNAHTQARGPLDPALSYLKITDFVAKTGDLDPLSPAPTRGFILLLYLARQFMLITNELYKATTIRDVVETLVIFYTQVLGLNLAAHLVDGAADWLWVLLAQPTVNDMVLVYSAGTMETSASTDFVISHLKNLIDKSECILVDKQGKVVSQPSQDITTYKVNLKDKDYLEYNIRLTTKGCEKAASAVLHLCPDSMGFTTGDYSFVTHQVMHAVRPQTPNKAKGFGLGDAEIEELDERFFDRLNDLYQARPSGLISLVMRFMYGEWSQRLPDLFSASKKFGIIETKQKKFTKRSKSERVYALTLFWKSRFEDFSTKPAASYEIGDVSRWLFNLLSRPLSFRELAVILSVSPSQVQTAMDFARWSDEMAAVLHAELPIVNNSYSPLRDLFQ